MVPLTAMKHLLGCIFRHDQTNKLQNYMEPSGLSPKRKVTSETHYDLTDLKMFKLIQTKRHSARMRT